MDKCRTHIQSHHHFFLNYRSFSDKNFVSILYAILSLKTIKDQPVYVFLDENCLKFGKTVEKFMDWLSQSKVIILVILMDGLKTIIQQAPIEQDNVLVEYHTMHSKFWEICGFLDTLGVNFWAFLKFLHLLFSLFF